MPERTDLLYQFMPDLTPEEEAGLRESIREQGVLQAVLTDEAGVIIDGHNRARIADELGVTYVPEVVTGLTSENAKIDFAFRINMAKRNLSTAQKQELIRKYLERRWELTDREVAKTLSVDHKTVASVRNQMPPPVMSDLSNGEIPHKDSDAVDDEMPAGDDEMPAGDGEMPVAEPEPERLEASGRRARGQRRLTQEEKDARAETRRLAAEAARQATRDAMVPGQRLRSDAPRPPARTVTWNTRLWSIVGSGTLPGGVAEELEAADDISSVSDSDLTVMAARLQEQIRARQRLRTVLLNISKERKNHNG